MYKYNDINTNTSNNNDNLPIWTIIIHFQSFPFDKIINCSTLAEIERYYNHSLKQALFLMNGSTNAYNSLTVESKKVLWDSINIGDNVMYQSITNNFLKSIENIKLIPVKFLIVGYPIIQLSIQSINKHGHQVLLKDSIIDINKNIKKESNEYKVIIQGIDMTCHLNVSMYNLWHLFSHGDLFLYIIVVYC